jgi:hypothetical protein
MITMVMNSMMERHQDNRPPFRYTIILTKTDKASQTMIMETKQLIKEKLDSIVKNVLKETDPTVGSYLNDINIIESSAVFRTGRFEVWKSILEALKFI